MKLKFERLIPATYSLNGKWEHGWQIKTWVNAKNSYGGYTGDQPCFMYFRDGTLRAYIQTWKIAEPDWGKEKFWP